MMSSHYGNRLIWDRKSPAPFESAWSIFVKLLLLNGMKTNHIASLISKPVENVPQKYSLDFRRSGWIDFERFSKALQIEERRLYVCFLDQLGIHIDAPKYAHSPGVRVCKECLAKGYHCVFYEIGFIDYCPWHQIKLEEACWTCEDFVIGTGSPKVRTSKNSQFSQLDRALLDTYDSGCGHIHFCDSVAFRPIQFTLSEQKEILNGCTQFLQWSLEVFKSPEISRYIFKYALDDSDPAVLSMHISAAENIAGPCPWPITHTRKNIRSHIWRDDTPPQSQLNSDNYQRGSDGDLAYRSIRRHLFKKYVLAHQACWKEIKNYSHQESLRICSAYVCPVALAYAIWRLHIERFYNVEVFKFGKFGHRPILKYDVYPYEIPDSLKTQSSLMYAQFFYIWDKTVRLSSIQNSIVDEVWSWNLLDMAIIPDDQFQSDEWTVILPDYRTLENQSLAHCCGAARTRGWMLNPGWKHHWDDYFKAIAIKDHFQVRTPIVKEESINQYVRSPGVSIQ